MNAPLAIDRLLPELDQRHLDHLEEEAIFILREVAASFERPALLFSGGKDSCVALRLAARDPQAIVRAVALSAAQRGHGEALWSELCAATEDNDLRVRIAALGGLAAALDGGARRTLPGEVSARALALIGNDDAERVHERWAAIRLAGYARIGADDDEVRLSAHRGGDAPAAQRPPPRARIRAAGALSMATGGG